MNNQTIAERLRTYANELSKHEGNLYRVRSYRKAAAVVTALPRDLQDVWKESGREGLEALPGIGQSLAYTLEGLIRTGELRTLSGDDGHADREHLLTSLPGVGPRLAERLRDRLQINTLEELAEAADDGRLAIVGVAHKRLRGLQDALTIRLQRTQTEQQVVGEPPVRLLLEMDEEFRRRAAREVVNRPFDWTITGEGWTLRARFADTALAVRLRTTKDWVVIDFSKGESQGQRTVVTETRGALRGRRVVRGRERECR